MPTCLVHNCETFRGLLYFHLLSPLSQDQIPFDPHQHVNQELDQYLWLFVNERQDNWYDLLPIAEFQYNNHVHSTTQQPLFLLDTRRISHMGFEPQQNHSNLETVNEFTKRMRIAIEEAKSTIHKAQDDMKRYYDCRRTLAPVRGPLTHDSRARCLPT